MVFQVRGTPIGALTIFIAALASLGGLFLVWTGFALSWRRFFPGKRAPLPEQTDPAP